MSTYQQHFDTSCELRNDLWNSVGKLDPDVIAHMINPSFMGGPAWPSLRQAFATIRTPERTIIASDGLSDPYDDSETNPANAPYNGFGLEVYVAAEPITGGVQTTWEFQLLYQAAQLVAQNGSIINLFEEMPFLSTELYDVDVPAEYKNAEGRVGVLLGLPDEKIPGSVQLSLESVKLVNVKLLTLAELDYVIANGEEGRVKLAELIQQQGHATLSTLKRKSVI
ncbi:suppressor of fused domain protein [Chitinophaga sp. GbtcB8]|uniref:suppressor of fused domain protein n=1 Tax=Chitinophaga sp. GbtcB8 TaxID=2824753 RepID=UPI001C306A34|nr:suppressor of fused domain protein [Chitinophaga sp. GbtcB8]